MENLIYDLQRKRRKQNKYATIYPLFSVEDLEFVPTNEVLEKTEFYKIYNEKHRDFINDNIYIPELNMEITRDIIKYFTKKGITEHNFTLDCFSQSDDFDRLRKYLENYADYLKIINVKKIYKQKAIFFLEEEARDYIESQIHNLKGPRINVVSIGNYNNSSLRKVLEFLDGGIEI